MKNIQNILKKMRCKYLMGSLTRRCVNVVFKLEVVGFHRVTVSWNAIANTEPSSEKESAEGTFCRKSPAMSQVHASFFPTSQKWI